MIEIVANKTGEVLTILKIYSEGRTKSDWFEAIGKDGTIYELEIFGVTKNTKHCIRLLLNGKELEVFHLYDIEHIKRLYALKYLNMTIQRGHNYRISLDQNFPFARQTLLDNSKQLWLENNPYSINATSKADTIAETIRDDYRAAGISCRVRQGKRLGGDING